MTGNPLDTDDDIDALEGDLVDTSDAWSTRNVIVIALAVVAVVAAICAAVTITNVSDARRDEHVRVACVTSGSDFYPQDGGKCVHTAG